MIYCKCVSHSHHRIPINANQHLFPAMEQTYLRHSPRRDAEKSLVLKVELSEIEVCFFHNQLGICFFVFKPKAKLLNNSNHSK